MIRVHCDGKDCNANEAVNGDIDRGAVGKPTDKWTAIGGMKYLCQSCITKAMHG